ncbi:uncharacterized protein N7484_009784 [Penicillium longicatenatum]|uniref:uncharacterized protein n=1 Tax=Penicillium longicatenatum TaxID=1561947 RepID=UPI002547C6C8|nr:uncharacterized protein N7484_009784 [Penicillium longicatenatum]KAJ5636471.1 hypothetical protein N7484_009784 [Penicillium longicatenatum]
MEYPGHLYFDRFDSDKIHTGSGTFILGHRAQDEPVEETFNNMSISSSPQQEEYGLSSDGVFLLTRDGYRSGFLQSIAQVTQVY